MTGPRHDPECTDPWDQHSRPCPAGEGRVMVECRCGGQVSGECAECHRDLAGHEDHYDDGDTLLCGDCYRESRTRQHPRIDTR